MFLASEQLESDPSSRGLEWENFPDQRFGRCRSKHTLAGGDHGAKIFNCFVTACEVFRTKLDQDTQLNCGVVCIFWFMWHCRISNLFWPQLRREIMLLCTKLDRDTQLNFSAVCSFVPCCSGRDGETPEGGMLVSGCSAVAFRAFRAFRQDDSLS